MTVVDKINDKGILEIKKEIENNNFKIIDEYVNYLEKNDSNNLLSLLCSFIEQISPDNVFDIINYLLKNPLVVEKLNNITEESDMIEGRILTLLFNMYQDNINLEEFYSKNLISLYFKDISREELLSYEEEQALLIKIKKGNLEAKQKFISANLRLVVSFAKKFTGRGMEFLDLIQEGNLGIINAVERFDPSKGCRFSTYASYWIRDYMFKSLSAKSRQIRVPNNIYIDYNKFLIQQSKLRNELGREPTSSELALELNCTIDKINEFYLNLPIVTSYNEFFYDNSGDKKELIDFIPSKEDLEGDIIDQIHYDELCEFLKKQIEPRKYEIFIKRNGLDGNEKNTLQQLADEYSVSKENIRVLEKSAKKKMNNYIRNSLKFGYLAYDEMPVSKKIDFSFEERAEMFLSVKGREKYVQNNYKFPDGISMKSWFSFNKELIRSLNTRTCLNIINEYYSYFSFEDDNMSEFVEINKPIVKRKDRHVF